MTSTDGKKIYHVVAMANNRVIGKNNQLPWHFSSDLKHFKQLTMDAAVIMGRKTYESIFEATKGKLLPGREMIYLSRRSSGPNPSSACRLGSLEEALNSSRWGGKERAYIIGGAELYRQTMEAVDGIYLTRIEADFEGDAFYPELPPYFKVVSRTLLQDNPKIEVLYYDNTRKAVSHA